MPNARRSGDIDGVDHEKKIESLGKNATTDVCLREASPVKPASQPRIVA